MNGDVNTSGTFRCLGIDIVSDASKKENIKPINKGNLKKLANLQGVSFTYKVPAEEEIDLSLLPDTGQVVVREKTQLPDVYLRQQIGFLAQELQQVYPELVSEDKEGTLGINYIGLIPILVEAIKEQEEAIEKLQEEIISLKTLSGNQ